jgi:TPR repeat protein
MSKDSSTKRRASVFAAAGLAALVACAGADAQVRLVSLTSEQAAGLQDPRRQSMAQRADEALKRADYAEARRLFLLLAPTSVGGAQLTLGQIYERGLGVTADPIQAWEWYRKADESFRNVFKGYQHPAPPEIERMRSYWRDAELSIQRVALVARRAAADRKIEEQKLAAEAEEKQREKQAADMRAERGLAAEAEREKLAAELRGDRERAAEAERKPREQAAQLQAERERAAEAERKELEKQAAEVRAQRELEAEAQRKQREQAAELRAERERVAEAERKEREKQAAEVEARRAELAGQLRLGITAYALESFAESMDIFLKLAQQPPTIVGESGIPFSATAKSFLGNQYFLGQGVPRDFAKAEQLLKEALDLGDKDSQLTHARLLERRTVRLPMAAELSEILDSQRGFRDDSVLLYINPVSPRLTIKLDGSPAFKDASATLCLGATTREDSENWNYTEKSGGLNAFVAGRIRTTIEVKKLDTLLMDLDMVVGRDMSKPRPPVCRLNSNTWDIFDLTKSGLEFYSQEELVWLKANMSKLRLVATISLADFQKDLADREAVEAANKAKAEKERQQKEAAIAERNAKREAARKTNFDIAAAGSGSASALYFLSPNDEAAKGVCFVQDADRDKVLDGILLADHSSWEEPLFPATSEPKPLPTLDAVFAQLQHHGCGLVMGSASELKTLIDGWKRISDRQFTALSAVVSPAVRREFVKLADQKQENERMQAELQARRHKEEEAAEAARREANLRAYPYRAILACGNGYDLTVCLSGHHVDATLEINNGSSVEEYKHYSGFQVREFGPGEIDLHEHFHIKTMNASDFATLNLTLINRRTGEKLWTKSASQFEWINVKN